MRTVLVGHPRTDPGTVSPLSTPISGRTYRPGPEDGRAIELLLQRLIDGLANGAVYGWLALSFSLVYKSSGRLNLAQGEIANVGAYVALVFASAATPTLAGTGIADRLLPFSPFPSWLAIVFAMMVAAALAVAIERWVIRPAGDNTTTVSISLTIAMLLILNSSTTYVWFPINRAFPSPFPTEPDDFIFVGGARLRYEYIGTFVTLAAVAIALFLFLRLTKVGLAFRAVSSDPTTARLMGIRSSRIFSLGWALAAAIGTLAGSLVANRLILEPNMMVRLLVFGFAAGTIGGLDSLAGAVIGGLLIGVFETFMAGYLPFIGATLAVPVILAIMVIMLLIRPTGIMGTARVTRV